MGLIKAVAGAVGGTLHDQWLDAVRCDDMDVNTLMVKAETQIGNQGVISKGSRIIVNVGQAALLVDNGAVVDACAEPGAYIFDESSSATVMYGGDFKGMFKEMWERFKYGGSVAKEQAVYFINLKEMIGNKFGTPTPIPYSDWGHPTVNPRTSSLYGMSVKIRVFGKYTFRITDPFQFLSAIAGNAKRVTKDLLAEQMSSELLSSFRNTLAELGSDNYRTPALDLPHKDDEIVTLMKKKEYDNAIKGRGIEIISISVEGITFDDESQAKINQYEMSDEYTKSAYLAHAQGEALKSAASNPSGAGNTLIGMGIGFGAAGLNPMQQMQGHTANQGVSPEFAQKAKEASVREENNKDSWTCACGNQNEGNFCSECGEKKPIENSWVCSCGNENSSNAKFCSECGTKRAESSDGWTCSCGKEDNDGKFCSQCGKPKE